MALRVSMEWLASCSGCEIAFLDMGEDLLALLGKIEIVHAPLLMDNKYHAPESNGKELALPYADIGFISGSLNTGKHVEILHEMREKCEVLVALGTCAGHGGIPAMMNGFEHKQGWETIFTTPTTEGAGGIPEEDLPQPLFLVGIGAAGAATIAAPAISALAGEKGEKDMKWDAEHEVVIIGSGFAGLAAAIEAKKLGAKDVVVYDKMPYFGGNSTYNGGLFAVPDSPLQKEKGVKDSPENMTADQVKAGRGVAYADLLLHVARHANEALEMTLEAGSEYFPYLQQLGGHSVPRTYQTTVASGAGIVQPLVQQCKKLGIKLEIRAKFDSLIFDDAGNVVGATIHKGHYFGRGVEGTPVKVRAKRGVLIATGGFARNVTLRSAQDPTLTEEVPSTNPPSATGEGLLELFRVGAIPVHMAYIQTGPWASPDEDGFGYVSNYSIYNFAHSISIFPKTGKRFMNEIADRKTRSDAQLACRDDDGNPLPPITITSYEHAKEHPTMKKVLKYGVGWKFDNLEDLASHFNVPLEPLREQIEEYNGYVKSGIDEQFGKPMAKAKGKYVEAPFVVVRNWPKVHYCQGGAQIDIQARVIDSKTDTPIPGLYAAGEFGEKKGRIYHSDLYEDNSCDACHEQENPTTFPADDACFACHDGEELIAATARTGDEKWQNPHNNMHYGKDVPCMECHGEHT
ncbi:unnamed protein product, partial [Cyprideis torosa]